MYRKCPKIILVCQKCTKKPLGVLIGVVYQLVYQMSHAPKCTKCTKTHQELCLACKNSVTSVTVPNVTGVPNVTCTPIVPKMTKNHRSVPKMSQTGTRVPNRCTKRHMYQNAPNVEKRTRRDRSRCDDTRYRTKMTFFVPTVSPARPDNDSDHAKCGGVYYRLRL